jgi:acetyl-CoA C-acetyltransferase
MGHGTLMDSMIKDGLWDVYNDFHMGSAAEICAAECGIGRDRQDAFAADSYRKAMAAQAAGKFKTEIVPVPVTQGKETVMFEVDEEPAKGKIDRFPTLKPVFKKDGTVTAANASSLNDGAAALVVMAAERAAALGCKPLARIVAQGGHAQTPSWFTTAPAHAIEKTLRKAGLTAADIDRYEVNEAFAVVSLAVQDKVGYDAAKVNVWGGAVALGHPIGASGARILTTLLSQLADGGLRYGLASLCIGGGEAVALIVEKL